MMQDSATNSTADASVDAGERVAQILAVVERLAEIIAAENAHLQQREPSLLSETEAEKGRLAAVYRRQLQEIAADPTWLKSADPTDRDRLKEAVRSFEAGLTAHARMLVAVKAVTEGMVRTVAEEVQKRNLPLEGYGRNATTSAPAAHYGAIRPAAMAINQTI